MISYITLGADDLEAAHAFYGAVLPKLGYTIERVSDGLACTLSDAPEHAAGAVDLYIKHPFNEQPASSGNGTMIAIRATSQDLVRDLHAAALANGGQNEGSPGFRAAYSDHFYVAYLRDPQGNKLALFCNTREERAAD